MTVSPSLALRHLLYRLAFLVALAGSARAQTLPTTMINEANGLANSAPSAIADTGSGFLLIATQNGSYVFNGKRALALDHRNGLPDHEDFVGLSVNGTSIALYSSTAFFTATDTAHFVDDVRFERHEAPGEFGPIDDLAPTARGLLVIQARGISFYDTSTRRIVPRPWEFAGRIDLAGDDRISRAAADAVHGLWYVTTNGKLCHVGKGQTSCAATTDRGPYGKPLLLSDGSLYIRNLYSLLHVGPNGEQITIEKLPDQDWSLHTYYFFYTLATEPNGDLVTQSANGIITRHSGKWTLRRTGLTSITSSITFDHAGRLWLGCLGRGMAVVNGFGSIANYTRSDGLISNMIWAIAQAGDGTIWIGSDGGIDRIDRARGTISHVRDADGRSLVHLRSGTMLARGGVRQLEQIDEHSLFMVTAEVPDIQGIVVSADKAVAWDIGLTRIDYLTAESAPVPVGQSKTTPLINLAAGWSGHTAWTLDDNGITEWQESRAIHRIDRPWTGELYPDTLAAGPDDTVWIGSTNGLCRIRLSPAHDRLLARNCYNGQQMADVNVISVLIDHTNRVWAGTGRGLATFDGQSWQVIDRSDGLIWNDLNQDALFEDREHGLWIGTSQGLSYIENPSQLLHQAPLAVSISRLTIGGQPCCAKAFVSGSGSLLAELGSPGSTMPDRITFQYRLVGADRTWNQSSTGQISYPYLPSGRLRLQAQAVDTLNHMSSPITEVDLTILPPVYLRPAAIAAYVVGGLLLIGLSSVGIARIVDRKRAAHAQLLEGLVAERTNELEAARLRLEQLARIDGLTGIANRMTIERATKDLMQSDAPVSLVLLDLDHFKRINDEFGHIAGDAVLQEVARRLAASVMPGELCGRYGGEEFVICFPAAEPGAAERARAILGALTAEIVMIGDRPMKITCSAGFASREPWDTWETLLERADAALYAAKTAGRDRLLVASLTESTRSVERPA